MIFGKTNGVAIVEWEASPAGDVIADAVVALLMHAQSSVASIRLTSKPCRHPRAKDDESADDQEPSSKKSRAENTTESRLKIIRDTLRDQFELVEAVYEENEGTFEITGLESGNVDENDSMKCSVRVMFDDSSGSQAKVVVECPDQKLASNVQECVKNLAATLVPLSA